MHTHFFGSNHARRFVFNLVFWIGVFTFILGVRYYDIGNIAFLNVPVEIPIYRIFFNGLVGGLVVGFFYTLVEWRLDSVQLYNHSFLVVILLRTMYLFLVCIISMASLAYLNYVFDVYTNTIDPDEVSSLKYILSSTVRFLFLGALIGNFFLSVFHTLRSKIGYQEFNNLLMGKYREPQEEHRAFMFLDLKSSTTIAEKLGHKKYSRLIQDSFRDLTGALVQTEAEVYQYVGDEAVLSWPIEKAIENDNCLRAHQIFQNILEERSTYYQKQYGMLPVFKAGVNLGPVTVVEIGVLKRAIVYHSDVLNTASRIQSLCNQYDETLLVSQEIVEQLDTSTHRFEEIGDILLRGKTKRVKVYTVRKMLD